MSRHQRRCARCLFGGRSARWGHLPLLVAWLSTGNAVLARAHDYHVARNGDDAGPGTADRPWRTPERASRQDLEPGDRLLFAAG